MTTEDVSRAEYASLVRGERRRRHWTQVRLAEVAGLGKSTIEKAERADGGDLKWDTLAAIDRAFMWRVGLGHDLIQAGYHDARRRALVAEAVAAFAAWRDAPPPGSTERRQRGLGQPTVSIVEDALLDALERSVTGLSRQGMLRVVEFAEQIQHQEAQDRVDEYGLPDDGDDDALLEHHVDEPPLDDDVSEPPARPELRVAARREREPGEFEE